MTKQEIEKEISRGYLNSGLFLKILCEYEMRESISELLDVLFKADTAKIPVSIIDLKIAIDDVRSKIIERLEEEEF